MNNNNNDKKPSGKRHRPTNSGSTKKKRHRRSASSSSLSSAASGGATVTAITKRCVQFFQGKARVPVDQTVQWICNNPRKSFFKVVSMSQTQLRELRQRCINEVKEKTDGLTSKRNFLNDFQQTIQNLIAEVDKLHDEHSKTHNELSTKVTDLHNMKLSEAEMNQQIIDLETEKEAQEVQLELATRILQASNSLKPFAGKVTLEEVRKIMELETWAQVDALKHYHAVLCIRILDNFGLLDNDNFRAQWSDKTGEELLHWQINHSTEPQIATGNAEEAVVKMRLADYIGIPYEEGEDEDMDDEDDTNRDDGDDDDDDGEDDDEPRVPSVVGPGSVLAAISEEDLRAELERRGL